MKYQLGDKILILHSNEEGFIVDFLNDEMVLVDINGIQFPVYTEQIDFPYYKMFTQKKEKPQTSKLYIDQIPKEKNKQDSVEEDGVWLYFFPKFILDVFDDEIVEEFKIYLVNKTQYSFQFHYQLKYFGKTDFEIKNQLPAFKDFYIHNMLWEDVNDSPTFCLEFSLENTLKNKADFFETQYKIKPKQLFKQIEELKEKNEPSWGYQLFKEYPNKTEDSLSNLSSLSTKGYKVQQSIYKKKLEEKPRSVIDLHIDKITHSYKNLQPFEILEIQLKEFEKWLQLSIDYKMPNLIVIHGLGTGKLKEEIHAILKNNAWVKTFVNQFHPQFGFGATEIYFQY